MFDLHITPAKKDAFFNDKGTINTVNYIQMVLLIRIMRIFSLLKQLKQWRFFMRAIKVMRVNFITICFSLYSFYWFYTLIGMEIYGGLVTSQLLKDIKERDPNSEILNTPDYIYLNFNDFVSGLLTLFTFMLFNNWQFLWEQFVETNGKTYVANLFFLSFMLMSTYVIINILMAFIIDVYTSIEESSNDMSQEKKMLIQLI